MTDDNSAWVLGQWWQGPGGNRVSDAAMRTLVRDLAARNIPPDTWLAQHHYLRWQTYQPGSRFWVFQAIEGAGLLVVAILPALAAIWWVRRRAA